MIWRTKLLGRRGRWLDPPLFWKLVLPMVLLAVLAMLSSALGLLAVSKSRQLFDHLYRSHIRINFELDRVQEHYIRHELLMLQHLGAGPNDQQRIARELADLEDHISALLRRMIRTLGRAHPKVLPRHRDHQHEMASLGDFRQLAYKSAHYLSLGQRALKLSQTGQKSAAEALVHNQAVPLLLELVARTANLVKVEHRHVHIFYAEAAALQRRYTRFVIAFSLAAVVLALLIALMVSKAIARRMRDLVKCANALGRGDLSARVKVAGRDEFSELGEHLNQMAARLSSSIQTMKEQHEALRTAEQQLRSIIDNSTAAIYLKDSKGRYILVNRQCARLFGLSADQATGLTDDDLLPADIAATLRHNDRQVLERREPMEFEEVLEGGQTPVVYLTHKVPLLDEQGEPYAICGISTNITERKAVERLKSEFVAVVSHELRTPLTSIRGALGLLEGGIGGELSDQAASLIQIGRTNADRLIRLISSILDLEKLEAGKMHLALEAVYVSQIIAATLRDLGPMAAEAQVEIERCVFDPELQVFGDRDRLTQVLVNLVGNAVKFSPPGTKVIVSARPADKDSVRISVQDHGPGIAEEAQRQLFNKFSQLDSSDARRKGGTGLGLAISKAIVEQHQGKIGVESRLGHGATFYFLLPRLRANYEI